MLTDGISDARSDMTKLLINSFSQFRESAQKDTTEKHTKDNNGNINKE